MPDNEEKKEKTSYDILLERFDAYDKKVQSMEEKLNDVMELNKSLLNRREETSSQNEEESTMLLKKLKEDIINGK